MTHERKREFPELSHDEQVRLARILLRVCSLCRGRVTRMHQQYRRRRK